MHFSEEDLRAALQRKQPSPDFTQQVMARVGRPREQKQQAADVAGPAGFFARLWPMQWRWAMAGVVASLLLAGGLLAYRYQQEAARIRGEQARQEAIVAVRIAQAKLNLVFRHVQDDTKHDPKIRRNTI